MPNRRTRNRQLARVAQRRYEERRRGRQRRARITAGVVAAVVVAGVAGTLVVRNGGEASNAASGTSTPSASAGAVACGASVPEATDGKKPTFDRAPKMTIDPTRTYTATIDTSCGTIVVDLLADRAPKTVNSFVFLADKGFFDGTQIHRIDPSIDIIQGGDPTGTGQGGPGYEVPDELTGKESYGPGVVAMANHGANTGGSQFFVVYGPKGRGLDANPNYTIFGTVVKGLDVAQRIGALPVNDASAGPGPGQHPKKAVYLEKVTVSAKG